MQTVLFEKTVPAVINWFRHRTSHRVDGTALAWHFYVIKLIPLNSIDNAY